MPCSFTRSGRPRCKHHTVCERRLAGGSPPRQARRVMKQQTRCFWGWVQPEKQGQHPHIMEALFYRLSASTSVCVSARGCCMGTHTCVLLPASVPAAHVTGLSLWIRSGCPTSVLSTQMCHQKVSSTESGSQVSAQIPNPDANRSRKYRYRDSRQHLCFSNQPQSEGLSSSGHRRFCPDWKS